MPSPSGSRMSLSRGLAVEDHGGEFFLISEGEGYDITLSIENAVAVDLARFILGRRSGAGLRRTE